MRPSRRVYVAAAFATLLLSWAAALAQPPAVEESAERVVVSNAFYRVTLLSARGGFISEVALPDGQPVLSGAMLYTDHGLYPEGSAVSSDKETNPQVEVRREGERVVVESRGLLRGTGDLQEPAKRVEYAITHTFDASPAIQVRWSATPSFDLAQPTGFFSYMIGCPRYAEWFARTANGVVFQPAGLTDGRSYQSGEEPLDFEDPWMGLLLPDGAIVALSGLRGTPELTNVFMHENRQGATAVFCAWLSGEGLADLKAGEPWTGEFRLHIWPKDAQGEFGKPAFLR